MTWLLGIKIFATLSLLCSAAYPVWGLLWNRRRDTEAKTGPNAKLRAMYQRYDAVNRARASRQNEIEPIQPIIRTWQ